MLYGVKSIGGYFHCPDAVGGEDEQGELSELALGQGTGGGGHPYYLSDSDGVDAFEGEEEGVSYLGGVEFVGEEDDPVVGSGNALVHQL